MPALSADGRYAVFQGHYLMSFGGGPLNDTSDIYVYDRNSNLVTDISQGSGNARISGDGSTVVMEHGENFVQDILVTNVAGSVLQDITPAQVNAELGRSYANLFAPATNATGRYVVFQAAAAAQSGSAADYVLYDRSQNTYRVIGSTQGGVGDLSPAISADGSAVVFSETDQTGRSDVYLYNANTQQTASLTASMPGSSFVASISAEGRYVSFASGIPSNNLNDPFANFQTYVYDRQGGTLELISTGPNGAGNDGSGFGTALSSDGSIAAFGSLATNLVSGVTTPAVYFVAPTGGGTTGSIGEADDPVTYQWYSSANNYTTAIGTGSTYQVQEGDEGFTIEAKATATNDNGATASATSAVTAAVADAAPTITTPVITGTAQEGLTLTASATSGQGDNPVTYQWQRNGTNISGATGSTYLLTENDEGTPITVVATATNGNGATASATSASTASVIDVTSVAMVTIARSGGLSGQPLQGTQSFSQFLGFGDSNIDSGYFFTHPISNDPTRQSLYNAAVGVGGGLPTSLGGTMNSTLLAAHYGLTAIPIGESGGTNYAASGATVVGALQTSLAP